MRRPLIPILALVLLGAIGREFGQELPGPADRFLEKSDAVLVSAGGAYDMDLKVAVAGNRSLEYELRNYVKDSSVQRAIFQGPDFDKEDCAIRRGDLAYFKYHAWPKYDVMNARSSFLDSPFSWEDALGPGLSGSYGLADIAWDGSSGEKLLRCELKPLRTGSYRRIDVWIRPGSYQTVRRIYYTPSGLEWKAVRYGGYVMEGGIASAWDMTMVDELTNASASISVRMRRLERMPDSFFEPKDRSKER